MNSPTDTAPALAANDITPHIARLVLGHFRSGDSGLWLAFPSHGEHAVIEALCSVDPTLGACMGTGLPGLWEAIQLVRERGGSDRLAEIARTDGQPCGPVAS